MVAACFAAAARTAAGPRLACGGGGGSGGSNNCTHRAAVLAPPHLWLPGTAALNHINRNRHVWYHGLRGAHRHVSNRTRAQPIAAAVTHAAAPPVASVTATLSSAAAAAAAAAAESAAAARPPARLSDEAARLLRRVLARGLLHRLTAVRQRPYDGRDTIASALDSLGLVPLPPPPPPPPAFAAFAADVAAAPLRLVERHLGPAVPHGGYTTPSGKRCLLAASDSVHRLRDPHVEAFLVSLFAAVAAAPAVEASLSPHCLFHAHLFLARALHARADSSSSETLPAATAAATATAGGYLGVLFHVREYPAYDPEAFPYMLGHCQEGSDLRPTAVQMARRNVVWWQGQLALLDVAAGTAARGLLWDETAELGTVYEEDFGTPLADVTLDLPHSADTLLVSPRTARAGPGR